MVRRGVIMFQGVGSDVGKSLIVAGLCRVAANRGISVAPFKPQNMSNNAAVAEDGGEIGRAQWLQAVAARRAPSVHMNPVLLKPQSDIGAQIVVQGRVLAQADANDFQIRKKSLLKPVMESFRVLENAAELIIVEGAGSPAEVNLRADDIANMGFAIEANAPVILIGDIDRGGVIASLVGTHAVLDARDRSQVKGFIVNKFRGDLSLFDNGIKEIERRTGWPSFGVAPWITAASTLPAEDAVVLERPKPRGAAKLIVAAPMLSRIANFDDLDPLRLEPGVEVVMTPPGRAIPRDADLVILLGTKSTLSDLDFLRTQGWDIDILAHARAGGAVLGLCGGYQMLGKRVADPDGVEGRAGEREGLALLDVTTEIGTSKTTRNVRGQSIQSGDPFEGYEIHMGRTVGPDSARPFLEVDGQAHGATSSNGQIRGAYVHGLFGNDRFRRHFLARLGAESTIHYSDRIDTTLDEVAEVLEKNLDVDGLLNLAMGDL
jgi:adenosylcobyric acid synthase